MTYGLNESHMNLSRQYSDEYCNAKVFYPYDTFGFIFQAKYSTENKQNKESAIKCVKTNRIYNFQSFILNMYG